MKIDFNKRILIGILIASVVFISGFFIWKAQKLEIITDGMKYENGGILKVKLKNLSLKNLCLSSCYPYYLEKKMGEWEPYSYQACPHPDLAEKCIGPLGIRAFEASLPKINEGTHRLSVPVCIDCQEGEEFREDKRFYSNGFEIK